MHRLFRSIDRTNESGTALPIVWESYKTLDINLYRGDLVMWASPPGTGKSAKALNYILKSGSRALYISCDMGRSLVARRCAAIMTHTPVNQVREDLKSPEGEQRYREALSAVDHLYMAYPSRPDAKGIATQLLAFQEIHGLPPEILCLDNLMNLNSGQESEWAGLRDLCQVLHYFAVEFNICVLVLHHLNLGGLDLSIPAPINFIKGQVTELPALVLTMAKRNGQLLVAPVKNRHGKADDSGKTYIRLDFDEERQVLTDPVPEEVKPSPWNNSEVNDWYARRAGN